LVRPGDAQVLVGADSATVNQLYLSYDDQRPVLGMGSDGSANRLEPVLYERKYLDCRRQVPVTLIAPPAEAIDRFHASAQQASNVGRPAER
jgi:hypothetical protein